MKIVTPLFLMMFFAAFLHAATEYFGYQDCEELISGKIRAAVTPSGAGRLRGDCPHAPTKVNSTLEKQ